MGRPALIIISFLSLTTSRQLPQLPLRNLKPQLREKHDKPVSPHPLAYLRGGGERVRRIIAKDWSLLREDVLSLSLFWVASSIAYLVTLNWCDRRAAKLMNVPAALDDLGFAAVPKMPFMAYLTDGFGSSLALWTTWAAFRGKPSEQRGARYVIFCVAVGNFFSATLHTFTLLPSPDFMETSIPLMGGKSDKLMSNHVFNTSLVLQLLASLGYVSNTLALLGIALYSVSMLSTRAHYSVDIILAWWAVAASRLFAGMW